MVAASFWCVGHQKKATLSVFFKNKYKENWVIFKTIKGASKKKSLFKSLFNFTNEGCRLEKCPAGGTAAYGLNVKTIFL